MLFHLVARRSDYMKVQTETFHLKVDVYCNVSFWPSVVQMVFFVFVFLLANCVDSDQNAASDQGRHCFIKYRNFCKPW